MPERELKTEKFDIRMTEQERVLIKQAARLRRTTPTSFIREQAVSAAEGVVHEQTRFVLTEQQWQILEAAFGKPARVLPNLQRKLAESDLWD